MGEMTEELWKSLERKPKFDENGVPTCWGRYVKGIECDCPHRQACREYTFDRRGERKMERRWQHKMCSLLDGIDLPDPNSGEMELDAMADGLMDDSHVDGDADASALNLRAIVFIGWFALEQPNTARALLLRLMPDVKNLQDVADIMGITRQGVQKRIKAELGMEKRNYKTEEYLRLEGMELDVYRLCVKGGLSLREAAKRLKVSHWTVANILKSLDRKGFKRGERK